MANLFTKSQFRHELKFLITNSEAEILRRRLTTFMRLDPHTDLTGNYRVRSLYFDDLNFSAYRDKMDGVPSRQKFRIRIYNSTSNRITLERKIKEDSFVQKQSAPLTRSQVEMLQSGNYSFLLKTPHPLHKIFYFEVVSRVLRPTLIVEYEREPYLYEYGDVRVTFDRNVRAVLAREDIFSTYLPTALVLEPGKLILEVKYTQFFPSMIRDLLPTHGVEFVALSKYVSCFDKTLYKR